ncbi:methyl-accepting chemotaxis protein [Campylobacterota bacterium]|nr:methyl-accepting chemotaxis protein [Campylobacterota bacterium]
MSYITPGKTIRSKMIMIVFFTVLVLGIAVIGISINTYNGYKTLQVSEVRSLVTLESARIKGIIQALQSNVRELALSGEILYRSGSIKDTQWGWHAISNNFKINTLAIGGGIWFEPYAADPAKELSCYYAYIEGDKVITDESFESADYNYPKQDWYVAIKSSLANTPGRVVWTEPYIDDAGTHALMTSVGSGVYDSRGRFVGMATLDWQLDAITEAIAALRPTKNSFALFADLEHNTVLGSTDQGADSTGTLAKVSWFNANAPFERELLYNGVRYLSFFEKLDNGMVIAVNVPVDELFSATTQSLIYTVLVLALTAIVVVVVTWLLLDRFVTKRLSKLTDGVTEIAQGVLTHRLDESHQDEIGEMVLAFNLMMDKLQASFKNILASVHQVNDEVASFSKAAESVASGSQVQSAGTSSVAASVEEMTASISTVSNSATDAQKMAQEAGEVSRQGRAILEKTTNEMSSTVEVVAQTSHVIQTLGEESRQISSVVQVIKDVADQTNLLALNAAIEAARAGDQGRGFAVVADEVRKLAERTAKSIDDITMMISKIQASANEAVEEMDKVVRQVEQGQKLTQEAGAKMHTISDQSSKVSKAIDEISNALREQSSASQDIERNVESIAQMTDKNSDSANSAAKGAKRLGELSGEVQNTLSQFKV